MLVAGVVAALASCASVPAANRQDVEFVRGCWVEKSEPGGMAMGFLRLLPDGADYAGALSRTVDGKMRDVGKLAFARDGSRLTVAYASGEAVTFESRDPRLWPAEPNKAEFVRYAGSEIESVGVGGAPDRLAIGFGDGLLGLVVFERDGCD